MRDEESGFGSGSVLLSFLLGGMVGAGLALLLAPQAGTETRRRIREFTDDVKDKTTDYISQTRDRVSSTVEKGKSYIDEKKTVLSAAIEAGKEAYEKEVHKP
ncbi:MAG: YtxH domain-containing protein [Alphaproteobacteria bacterium]|uniref:YtxH domain-containing protein n=1 Tax=Candidatus Nitrobium versatile TaxID=2884831 RepID=A0A953J692_9BACT|nr:YtxH domain-containing protein [Candidatus Nitrobium versatile]